MTLVFAGVMLVVLGATGVFVYLRFEAELDQAIDSGLRSRAADLAALARQASADPGAGGRLVGRTESFAEVIGPGGGVVDSSEAVGRRSLLSAAELRRARAGELVLERGPLPGLEEESRLLARPVQSGALAGSVVVVGTSTEARAESLEDLRQLLFLGGPVALILASLAAYGVAAAALRPVEAMRARAATISAAEPDGELPVPPSGDEVARLGRTLNEMLARLAEALAHERAFVADASHELRTPLAILRTELELALAEGRSPQELRAAIASAAEETDRLTQLSEDLLTIAQTERGELPLRLERVELGEVSAGVRRRFSRRAEEEGRRIELAGGPLAVRGDRLRLDQALGSVVDNALRYGAGTVRIELRAGAPDPGRASPAGAGAPLSGAGVPVEVHVTDEGEGFSPEFLERAFERFSRASSSRRDGGSGLGLAIVRTVARAHGGEAFAANRESGGADVWLNLPPA